MSYGSAYATAWRTCVLLNGGRVTFMPTYHSAFSTGVLTTFTLLFSVASSEKSFGGSSKVMSMSPFSSSARRLPADGTSRWITRLMAGSGPLFQSSKRAYTISWPGR